MWGSFYPKLSHPPGIPFRKESLPKSAKPVYVRKGRGKDHHSGESDGERGNSIAQQQSFVFGIPGMGCPTTCSTKTSCVSRRALGSFVSSGTIEDVVRQLPPPLFHFAINAMYLAMLTKGGSISTPVDRDDNIYGEIDLDFPEIPESPPPPFPLHGKGLISGVLKVNSDDEVSTLHLVAETPIQMGPTSGGGITISSLVINLSTTTDELVRDGNDFGHIDGTANMTLTCSGAYNATLNKDIPYHLNLSFV